MSFQGLMVTKADDIRHLVFKKVKECGRPIALKELFKQLRLRGKLRRQANRVVAQMISSGELVSTRGGRLDLPKKRDVVTGQLEVKKAGFGFVVTSAGECPDIYIAKNNFADALHGDLVQVHVNAASRRGRPEGRVLKIIERRTTSMVGCLKIDSNGTRVVPFDSRLRYELFLSSKELKGAFPGDMVVAEFESYPSSFQAPMGSIVEVLGDVEEAGVDVSVVLAKYGISEPFPENVLNEADLVEKQNVSEHETLSGREDFRGRKIVTIDGATARDFDVAVEVEVLGNGDFLLGVHIADVSYYVGEESGLNAEAYLRGTSVYFPDRAVPMLPENLSNGICSLSPGVDRLVQSVIVTISSSGEVKNFRFADGVIRSFARMTYSEVKAILVDRNQQLRSKYEALIPSFERMLDLYKVLNSQRKARGAIDFERPDAEVVLDATGKTINIRAEERNIAHRIIEEFMLLANEVVASYISSQSTSCIYRVHEKPDVETVQQLENLIQRFGYRLRAPSESLVPKMFQKLLVSLEGKHEERFISLLVLRSMKKAVYSSKNIGHYALASTAYTHFTSPIRRYPDLVVHRILRSIRSGMENDKEGLRAIAEHCSIAERHAAEAERELIDWKKVRFMSHKIGDVFKSYVSGVAGFGLYVDLSDFFVEGLVHVRTLTDDYYHFDERQHMLKGAVSGRVFRLGDEVNVQLVRANLSDRRLEFIIDGMKPKERFRKRSHYR